MLLLDRFNMKLDILYVAAWWLLILYELIIGLYLERQSPCRNT